jgi:hypothetical protein
VVMAPTLGEMVRWGEVRRRPTRVEALGGFDPKRRVWKRKKGGLAAGKTRGVGRARAGGSGRGKTGEDEKPLTSGARLLCWRFKSKQTDPKQFKQIRIQIKPIQTSFYPNMTFPSSKNLK